MLDSEICLSTITVTGSAYLILITLDVFRNAVHAAFVFTSLAFFKVSDRAEQWFSTFFVPWPISRSHKSLWPSLLPWLTKRGHIFWWPTLISSVM